MAMQRKQLPIWAPLEETNTLELMREWFSRTLSGRRCMLVVDNCTDATALRAFEGTGFTLLVTTRNLSLAEEIGAHRCMVPLAFGDLAPKILNAAAGPPLPTCFAMFYVANPLAFHVLANPEA